MTEETSLVRFWGCLVGVLVLACGARTPLDVDVDGDGARSGSGGTSGALAGSGGSPGVGGDDGSGFLGLPDRCVYLLSVEGKIHRLDPTSLAANHPIVQELSHVQCALPLNTMSVSDSGLAYVGTADGLLQPMDVRSGQCLENLALATVWPGGSFGLGLVRGEDGTEELYATPEDLLVHLAPLTGNVCCHHEDDEDLPASLVGTRPELADSDQNELYALYLTAGEAVVERYGFDDRAHLEIGVEHVVGWDAAHVDGEVLAFIAQGNGTTIHVLDTHPLTYREGKHSLPFVVIGAGLSPCDDGPPIW